MGLTQEKPPGPHDCPETGELLKELQNLARRRLCRPEQRQRCRAENGPFANWACKNCAEFLKPEAISPWTWHLLFLHRLKKAGYPFRPNDLSLEIWLLLGQLEEALAAPQGGQGGQQQL